MKVKTLMLIECLYGILLQTFVSCLLGVRSRRLWRYTFGVTFASFLFVNSVFSDQFNDEDRKTLVTQLEDQSKSSEAWSRFNANWDLTFKVALLVLGISAAIGATMAGTVLKQSVPIWLTVANIVIAASITGITAFNSTLNFAGRAELYRTKSQAEARMGMLLHYLDPDKAEFIRVLDDIYSWHDTTSPDTKVPEYAYTGKSGN